MGRKRITIDPVTRIEGHLKIEVEVKGKKVVDAWSSGTMARGFFVFAVLTGGILGLGIVNAVFVDEMVMDNNDALEAQVTALQDELRALRAQQDEVLRLLRERD